jgi:enamine deaminase RidA (YjgF/YER057c/UK114 family)
MTDSIESRLAAKQLTLPVAAAPAANYVPYAVYGNLLQTSGQLPMADGALAVTGKLGETLTLDEGLAAAQHCALNVLAQAKAALGGDLSRIRRLLKLTIFVASAPHFTDQHKVANGASDLLVEILGDAGRHARSAVGVPALPLDAAVEVEALFEIA